MRKRGPATCPKCRCSTILLKEIWTGLDMQFEQVNGVLNCQGYGSGDHGNPFKVEAFCMGCRHEWTLRGVTQISDFAQYTIGEQPTDAR